MRALHRTWWLDAGKKYDRPVLYQREHRRIRDTRSGSAGLKPASPILRHGHTGNTCWNETEAARALAQDGVCISRQEAGDEPPRYSTLQHWGFSPARVRSTSVFPAVSLWMKRTPRIGRTADAGYKPALPEDSGAKARRPLPSSGGEESYRTDRGKQTPNQVIAQT